jgi:hypothetical protein
MAYVIGPNGRKNHVPDEIAQCLVGDGGRGYAYAPEPKPAPVKRAASRKAA